MLRILASGEVRRAMPLVARAGAEKRVLEARDIRAILTDEPTLASVAS